MVSLGEPEVSKIIEETKKIDTELGQVEAVLEKERKSRGVKETKLKAVRKRTGKVA